MTRRAPASIVTFTSLRSHRLILGLLLAYQALFLNVFLPGHTRGAITLDGKRTPSCCASDDAPSKLHGQPSRRDREECAVCKFAAAVVPTLPIDFTLPPLRLLERRPSPTPGVVASVERLRTYLACGPPADRV